MKATRRVGIKKIAYLALLGASLAMGAVIAKVLPVQSPLPGIITPGIITPGIITYYSDPSKLHDIGSEIITCDGLRYFLWGQAEPYKSQELFYCLPPIPS
jgi:hypothetical protein